MEARGTTCSPAAVRLRGIAPLLLAMAGIAAAQLPPTPFGVAALPGNPKLTLRIGQVTRFRLEAVGESLQWRWTLDGRGVSTGPQWTFVPSADDLGTHVVEASVSGDVGTVRHRWRVRVTQPRPPLVVEAAPASPTLSVEAESAVRLRLRAVPADREETVQVAWSVDGVPAGEGETLRLSPGKPGVLLARALATGTLGAAVSREWRITVRPRPTTTSTTTTTTIRSVAATLPPPPGPEAARGPAPPPPGPPSSASEAEPPRTAAAGPAAPRPSPPPVVASSGAPAPVSGGAIDPRDVRALLDRYAAAWQARDVGELRRLGQVTSDAQAAALGNYFASVGDLHVEVEVLDIQTAGDRATVRFRRRDRFRDPAGELTTQQSPPIEKVVVRASDGGLRFGAAAR